MENEKEKGLPNWFWWLFVVVGLALLSTPFIYIFGIGLHLWELKK